MTEGWKILKDIFIWNKDKKELINGKRTKNRVDGKIIHATKSLDSIQFNIYPNNTGYTQIFSFITKISIGEEFEGRVISVIPQMDENGKVYKQVTCEENMGYLKDIVFILGGIPEEKAADRETVIKTLLEYYNSSEPNLPISVGSISYPRCPTVLTQGSKSVYDCLTGGEILTEDDTDYFILNRWFTGSELKYQLNVVNTSNNYSDVKIQLGKNLRSIVVTPNFNEFCTRLYPKGVDKEGQEFGISDLYAPHGAWYCDSPKLIEKYGVIEGIKKFEDAKTEQYLKTRAEDYMRYMENISTDVNITAYDLKQMGLTIEEFKLGYCYEIICQLINYDQYMQLIQITQDLNNEWDVQLTFREGVENVAR